MLDLRRIYYVLLDLSLKLLVKSKIIPADIQQQGELNLKQPIIYVLPYNSKADLLTLRRQCLKHGLPNPLEPFYINGITIQRYIFIEDVPHIISCFTVKPHSISILHDYLNLHRNNPELDIQIVPVSVMFGRSPGKEVKTNQLVPQLRLLNSIEKFITILWLGRDSVILFSRPISLRYILTEHGSDQIIAQKIARIVRINFARQRLVASGPRLPIRQNLFNKLLASKTIEKAIDDEARSKKIKLEKAQQNAIALMKEIAADFSYEAIRMSDRVLSWTWNHLYQGLHVSNAYRVRQLAEEGHEIVYMPCHRSHMDYLLLSYVIYHHGLVPPHITAGINLNFWPAGPIFRRLGAFFIRRTFNSNKLYSTIFREYLSELFIRGYSVEYFVEGGRSRTGRLLEPKTGALTITVQAMLRGSNRPITLIPIYVGYEHVIEVATYDQELRGAVKEKEGLMQMIRGIYKLRNLGQGYVNFGEPLLLANWLTRQVPQWYHSINPMEIQRPVWLGHVVEAIAATIMVRINNAAAANAINLCSSVLLASCQRSLSRPQLLSQLNCYLELLRNVPYAPDVTVPDLTPEALLEHALEMDKFTVEQNNIGDIIFLSRDQAVLMNYYRNNIQHLLILPSLVAHIINNNPGINCEQLHRQIKILYPMLKAELFMRFSKHEVSTVVDNLIIELQRQRLVALQKTLLYPSPAHVNTLKLLAASVHETLQRYAITFLLLYYNPHLNYGLLKKESLIIAQQLTLLYDINAQEFFDKTVFSTLIATLRNEGYIRNDIGAVDDKIGEMCDILSALIAPEILTSIKIASKQVNLKSSTLHASNNITDNNYPNNYRRMTS